MMSDEGGTEWEQGKAVDRMVIAMRAGDADGMALALADYAAALGTRTTSSMAAVAGPLLVEIRAMRDERRLDAVIAQHKIDLLTHIAEDGQGALGRVEARIGLDESLLVERMRQLSRTVLEKEYPYEVRRDLFGRLFVILADLEAVAAIHRAMRGG